VIKFLIAIKIVVWTTTIKQGSLDKYCVGLVIMSITRKDNQYKKAIHLDISMYVEKKMGGDSVENFKV
jgi:hypothetical protein